MKWKKHIRAKFREAVFNRDRYTCVMCNISPKSRLDAHHITDRSLMPNGGYVVENGISLCEGCHMRAEQYHRTGISYPGYSPDELYMKIKSSYELALNASRKL